MARRRRRALVPEARTALDQLKYSVLSETGVAKRPETAPGAADPWTYRQLLEHYKWHIAEELGLDQKVRSLGWADMPTRDVGAIGGHLGGQIGGQMVRRMIALAEERIAQGAGLQPAAPFGVGPALAPRFAAPMILRGHAGRV
ncbi:MAG: small, acid-soluble spore protein, alpha/beta type [Bacillota bacterium]